MEAYREFFLGVHARVMADRIWMPLPPAVDELASVVGNELLR